MASPDAPLDPSAAPVKMTSPTPAPMAVVGALTGDEESQRVQQIAIISGWMRRFTEQTRPRLHRPQP